MSTAFFDHPILNSPYEYPSRHWELDASGQPTQKIAESRRRADFVTPIPKPKKQKGAAQQQGLAFEEHSSAQQQYSHAGIINGVRALQCELRCRGLPVHADASEQPR